MVELCPLDCRPRRKHVLYVQQREHLTSPNECDTIEVVKDCQGLVSQRNGSYPLWFLQWLAVPENICDFSLKSAGEPALLIMLCNDDVGKHWRKGRNGNLIEYMLLFLVMACILTHRMPPLPISLIFD